MSESDETNPIGVAIDQESRPKSFAADELINCDKCARANPPTRLACLYCGAALATAAQLEVSPLADSEDRTASSGDGFYVVLIPRETDQIDEAAVSQLALLLQVKTTELQNALSAGGALPLRLAKSAEDANRFTVNIQSLGLQVVTVAENQMKSSESFVKIRAIELADESLSGLSLTSGARFTVEWSELNLLVVGRLITTQTEVEEKRRGQQQQSDGRQNSADEAVLDIWTDSNTAWRIFVNSFDFSCLGSMKSLTAFENAKALVQSFRERAPNIQINESYARVRPVLANVWPLEEQTRGSQLRHTGIGKRQLTTVTATDNQTQFNSYSRLLHYLRLSEIPSRQ
jgi:hypothetical protein